MYIKYLDNCQWENIALLPYKDGDTHYKSITKQILFEGLEDIPCQLRYFEIAPEGYSTLEHHFPGAGKRHHYYSCPYLAPVSRHQRTPIGFSLFGKR